LKPGQETNLSMEFTMHAGMEGPHDFKVVLASNDPDEPTKELRVLSNWVQ